MSNKYDAYIQIGKALRSGDEKGASNIAKVIIKSDRIHKKNGILFSEKILVSRERKKILKSSD